jgi:protein TonB
MLGYAARRSTAGARPSSPQAMLLIISAHVALIAVVMSAKMDLPPRIKVPATLIDWVPAPVPPPPAPTVKPRIEPRTSEPQVDHPDARVPTRPADGAQVETGGTTAGPGPIAFGGTGALPSFPPPLSTPIRRDARLLTPPWEIKPPYPESKLLSEEEATLTLRLTIDERGRVVDVQPVGRADPAFLAAARRHLIAHWRYQPASEDGRPIDSSVVVTLRFQLDG